MYNNVNENIIYCTYTRNKHFSTQLIIILLFMYNIVFNILRCFWKQKIFLKINLYLLCVIRSSNNHKTSTVQHTSCR